MNMDLQTEAKDLNQQSIMLIKANNFEAAKKKLDKAIDMDPMLVDSYKNYGDLYMGTGEYNQAKAMYKKAILIEKRGIFYYLYGNACFMNDNAHEGLEYYNLALSNGYDDDNMLFFMGMAYEHMNDDEMALRYFSKANIKNPSRPDYLVKKIQVLLRLNMMEDAQKSIDDLVQNSPELYEGYYFKIQMLLYKKQYEEAVEFAKMAHDKFPEDADLMYDYARAVALASNYDEALQLTTNAKSMKYYEESKQKFAILEAQIYADKGDIENAITACRTCIELDTYPLFTDEANFMLMNIYLAQQNFEETYAIAATLVENKREDKFYYAALYYKAFSLSKLGRAEEAKAQYTDSIRLYRLVTLENPEAVDMYLYRAMCLKDIGEYDKALDLLEFMEGLTDRIAEIYTVRAEIYKLQNKETLRKAQLEKAFALKPELKAMLPDGE